MTTPITRQPALAEQNDFDLIVVGGGVYGITLTLEAARRGYRPLLLEQNDFNAGTSFNSLRIVHGGLRYLQTLDLRRFFESVHERRWFLRHFPDLVGVLPCLMPLYNRGMKRRATMFAALKLNDTLSLHRNARVPDNRHLPKAHLLSAAQTTDRFPQVDPRQLKGAAHWSDGLMLHHQRLMIEALRWAVDAGAVALNHCRAESLTQHGGETTGLEATDTSPQHAGQTHAFTAPVVINATGPNAARFAQTLDASNDAPTTDLQQLFHPSLAFNLLLDHEPLSTHAVAIEPTENSNPKNTQKPRTYFVLPWNVNGKPRVLAGTFHAPFPNHANPQHPQPTNAQIQEFLGDLNVAVPGLNLQPQHVLRTYAGLLPAEKPGSEHTAHRPIWINHAERGGPVGAFSVSGVKYTTARLVAEQTLKRVYGSKLRDPRADAQRPQAHDALDFHVYRTPRNTPEAIRQLADLESAVYLDDILHRRTDWAADPDAEADARADLRQALDLPEAPKTPDTQDRDATHAAA